MHQAKGVEPFRNKGSLIRLTSPDYATPDVQQFEAVMPRPKVSDCAPGEFYHGQNKLQVLLALGLCAFHRVPSLTITCTTLCVCSSTVVGRVALVLW
jgi:hypothetical protein